MLAGDLRQKRSKTAWEGNEKAERKRWRRQCHAGRKALPGVQPRVCWGGGGGIMHNKRHRAKDPKGYQCSIASVMCREQQISAKRCPWPHNHQRFFRRRVRQGGKGGQGEGTGLSNFILSGERRRKWKWKERKGNTAFTLCCHPVKTDRDSGRSFQTFQDINSASDSVGSALLDVYRHCINDPTSFALFIPSNSCLSIPLPPTISHSLAPDHPPHTQTSSLTWPQHSDLTPFVAHWSLWWCKLDGLDIWLDNAGKSRENPSHSFMFISKQKGRMSAVLPACCIRQKHG